MSIEDGARPRFSLASGRSLRERADRVNEHAGRRARPRQRYLHVQRSRLAARLLPTLALIAAFTGLVGVVELAASQRTSRATTLAQVSMAILIAVAALLVPVARKSFAALVTLAASSAVVTLFGWAIAVRTSGGADSPYLMGITVAILVVAGFVPLPSRVALGIGVAGYAALLIGAAEAPLPVHLLVVMLGVVGYIVARGRQTHTVSSFRRLERLSAAVSRMRRVQEQLVVVEKLEALRVLVGGMAHELNNALAVSVASNQQALREVQTALPTAANAIKRSDGGLTRIRRTVDRLRRFAMAAEGVLEPADVGAMLDFALESAIGRARSGVIILREYDPTVGAIECHVAALAEALFQIARNAVEAMPGDGTIRATVRNEGDRVVLAVSDEGRGIPPEELARVFDPFYSRAQGQKSGLGLSAVYGLVSALGGRVDIQSSVGKGTEVAIVMPRKR